MKTLLTLLLAALAFVATAQPQKIHYQAVAVAANGKPIKNSTVGLRLSVLESLPTGSVLYSETQTASTDASGQFSLFLGGGSTTSGTFAAIPWANGNDKFLKVEMDALGGSNYLPMGTTQLVSVPYAMVAGAVQGSNGQMYQLTIGANGPTWTCYPPVTQANAGVDQLNVCASSINLSGNLPNNGTVNWSIISGIGGSLSTSNLTSTTFTGVRGNSYSLRYQISNSCGSSADTVAVSFASATTLANAGPDQSNLTGTTATLAANSPATGETGAWSILSGSGGSVNSINNPATVFTKGSDSTYSLVWTLTGPCGSKRDTVNLFFTTPYFSSCGQTLNYGGEGYPTIQIGTQCWLSKNFNFGTMINGTANPSNNGTIEKYCYNNDPNNCATYGGLYQWAEAVQYQNGASTSTSPNPAFSGNVKGICPSGWHLPSDAEFCSLTTFIDPTVVCTTYSGSGTDAGGKLKSLSTLWTTPNTGATNSSGFSALPSGYRITNGAFSNIGGYTRFWTSSEATSANGINRLLYNTSAYIYRDNLQKNYGFSIRCLLD